VIKWKKGEKIRKIDFNYYLINSVGLVLGYLLVYIGTEIFGGRDDLLFFNIVSITFGLSLGANFSSALKYETTFLSWTIYNVVQLIKAFLQLNIANIAKYIFYMINAAITLGDWIWNRDVRKKAALS
jgi:nicotinamide mononucleotide transporter